MSRDPVLNRIVQPIVDRLGVDPAPIAYRCADMFFLSAITTSAIDLALPGHNRFLSVTFHMIAAFFIRRTCRDTARLGPNMLLVQPLGFMHVIIRVIMFHSLAMSIAQVAAIFWLGLAADLQIMLFAKLLEGAEATLALFSIYLGICRKPPPRRRSGRFAPFKA